MKQKLYHFFLSFNTGIKKEDTREKTSEGV